ncbi:hypothetical protein ETSB_1149 [cyanobacterium endosymbiont of Epithemia turgida isolate EtSB Lake Yunoko]|nr:hypothetical protein ETSB_1149 [cyanobacterium endosymbiont of Epithemia turgida isolate EtSB Lake Yunoko]
MEHKERSSFSSKPLETTIARINSYTAVMNIKVQANKHTNGNPESRYFPKEEMYIENYIHFF